MASKRSSSGEPIYPPKKRALYEHKLLHGIENFPVNQISAKKLPFSQHEVNSFIHVTGHNVISHGSSPERNLKLPAASNDCSVMEVLMRPRSDSLQSDSQHSVLSEQTKSGSSKSRETSPCSLSTTFDHCTPERIPFNSLDSIKPDISKPLFPSSDSDSSSLELEVNTGSETSKLSNLDGENKENVEKFGNCMKENKPACRAQILIDPNAGIQASKAGLETKDGVKVLNMSKTCYMDNTNSVLVQKNSLQSTTRHEEHSEKTPLAIPIFNPHFAQGTFLMNHSSRDNVRVTKQNNRQFAFSLNDRNTQVGEPKVLVNCTNQRLNSAVKLSDDKPKDENTCQICKRNFSTKGYLHTHMKTHMDKSLPCWICKQVFSGTEKLNTHMKMEHKGENPYKCEHCSREFTQYNNLRRHMRVHRENIFKCELCDREFNEEFYLKMHMGTHTGKRTYSCGICGVGFPSNYDLRMHIKTHSPSLLHTCDECGKSFSKACVLRQHKKGHSNTRPYKCNQCDKTFIHRHHLTMHLKSHENEKVGVKRPGKSVSRQLIPSDNAGFIAGEIKTDVRESTGDGSREKQNEIEHESTKKLRPDYSRLQNVTLDSSIAQSFPRSPSLFVSGVPHSESRLPQLSTSPSVVHISSRQSIELKSPGPALTDSLQRSISSAFRSRHPSAVETASPIVSLPSMMQTFGHYPLLPKALLPPFYPALMPQLFSGLPPSPPISFPNMGMYSPFYQNYSEHLQKYYSHMQTLQAQNAAPKEFQSSQEKTHDSGIDRDMLKQEFNHSTKVEETDEKSKNSEPDGTVKTEPEKQSDDSEEELERVEIEVVQLGTENGVNEDCLRSENNGHGSHSNEVLEDILPVVTKTEEHEIAHELIKMSTGCENRHIEKRIEGRERTRTTPACDGTREEPVGSIKTRDAERFEMSSSSPGASDDQPSCLQKLQRFVESEKEHLDDTNNEFIENPEPHNEYLVGRYLGLTGNVVNDDRKNSVDHRQSNVRHEMETFESRLGKIKQFADIGQRLGSNLKCGSNLYTNSRPADVVSVSESVDKSRLSVSQSVNFDNGHEETDASAQSMEDLRVDERSGKYEVEETAKGNSEHVVDCQDVGSELSACKESRNAIQNLNGFNQTFPAGLHKENCSIDHYVKENSSDKHDISVLKQYFNVGESLNSENEKPMDLSFGKRVPTGSTISLEAKKNSLCVIKKLLAVDNAKVLLTCGLCSEHFETSKELHVHQNQHGEDLGRCCRDCNKVFSRPFDFQYHMLKYHHSLKENMRDVCELITSPAVKRPFSEKSNGQIGKVCDMEMMQNMDTTRKFIEKSDGQIRKVCDMEMIQNKETARKFGEKSDGQIGKGCDMELIKNKMTTRKFGENVDSNQTVAFVCQYCDEMVEDLKEFQIHLETHNASEKPYTCRVCLRSFAHRHNLNRHSMCHNTKSFECEICKRTFKEAFYLHMHLKSHDEENGRCEICGQILPRLELLRHTNEHLAELTENPTYEQIGNRVQEILKEKKCEQRAAEKWDSLR